jgi:hypothetical protein
MIIFFFFFFVTMGNKLVLVKNEKATSILNRLSYKAAEVLSFLRIKFGIKQERNSNQTRALLGRSNMGTNRATNGPMDQRTNGPTDQQTNRRTSRQTNRWTNRRTNRQTN